MASYYLANRSADIEFLGKYYTGAYFFRLALASKKQEEGYWYRRYLTLASKYGHRKAKKLLSEL